MSNNYCIHELYWTEYMEWMYIVYTRSRRHFLATCLVRVLNGIHTANISDLQVSHCEEQDPSPKIWTCIQFQRQQLGIWNWIYRIHKSWDHFVPKVKLGVREYSPRFLHCYLKHRSNKDLPRSVYGRSLKAGWSQSSGYLASHWARP